ncbi:hypothetical protein [Flavobacterium sp. RSP15]|uniref:hypothetical protein n=1 Tax=Flavobacterium sp. RSP15 TaxID=2497485 RepID=UPI000F836849|nr:hypothetical protein [Flavobacterium sp. RSP15]RTY86175.1 hypothetical protein EKM00_11690 [Flavobacterium sp. RSP15]
MELPNETENLFIEERSLATGSWISNPADNFYLYSEGYKLAADLVYNGMINNSKNNNLLIYPLVFNYRQHIELCLKKLIILGYEKLKIKKDFAEVHNLEKLWFQLKNDILINFNNEIESIYLDNIERLLIEFNTIDNACAFRFPIKTKKDKYEKTLEIDTVDFENFKIVMGKIIYYLDVQYEIIDRIE